MVEGTLVTKIILTCTVFTNWISDFVRSIAKVMVFFLTLSTMLWILITIGVTEGSDSDTEHPLDKKKRAVSRGYYGGVGYPYIPFAEPLTILAGLAFLAYIIQMFHMLYHTHNHGLLNGGGLLNNVLPPKSTKMFTKVNEENVGRVFY